MEWNCRVSSNFRTSVRFSSWSFQKVSASAYERCPLSGGYKSRVLVEKSPGQQFASRLRGVSPYERCLQAEVPLYDDYGAEYSQNKLQAS